MSSKKRMILSAIDIGSNAFRILISEKRDGHFFEIKKFRSPVRLGHDVFENGTISKETIHQALETFRQFAVLHKKYKVEKYRAVATSALRESKNKNEFIDLVHKKTGIKIELISGIEEAQIIFDSINREVPLDNKKALLIDIGGGSVEVSMVANHKLLCSQSFPLGTVRMLEEMKKRKLQERQLKILIGDFVPTITNYISTQGQGLQFHFAVGTGGNMESMLRLKTQLLKIRNTNYVTLSELQVITELLSAISLKDRVSKLELRPDRADVIMPALLTTKFILRQAGIEKMLVPRTGLRQGLLWRMK